MFQITSNLGQTIPDTYLLMAITLILYKKIHLIVKSNNKSQETVKLTKGKNTN